LAVAANGPDVTTRPSHYWPPVSGSPRLSECHLAHLPNIPAISQKKKNLCATDKDKPSPSDIEETAQEK
jgi:hypothetical protein